MTHVRKLPAGEHDTDPQMPRSKRIAGDHRVITPPPRDPFDSEAPVHTASEHPDVREVRITLSAHGERIAGLEASDKMREKAEERRERADARNATLLRLTTASIIGLFILEAATFAFAH